MPRVKLTVNVQNAPEHLEQYGWVVALDYEGELWFYDAWPLEYESDAYVQAEEVNGIVLKLEG